MCWYAGPGWPEVLDAMAGTPEMAAYLRRRFRSYASCWVPAARRQIVCRALATHSLPCYSFSHLP
jgi:hypothetical protein